MQAVAAVAGNIVSGTMTRSAQPPASTPSKTTSKKPQFTDEPDFLESFLAMILPSKKPPPWPKEIAKWPQFIRDNEGIILGSAVHSGSAVGPGDNVKASRAQALVSDSSFPWPSIFLF
jgi:hypothetical protein